MYEIGDKVVYIGNDSSYETYGGVYTIVPSITGAKVECIKGDDDRITPIMESEYIPFDLYNKLLNDNLFFKVCDVVHYIGKSDRIFKYGSKYFIEDVEYDYNKKTVILTFSTTKNGNYISHTRKYDLFVGVKGYRSLVINDILEV